MGIGDEIMATGDAANLHRETGKQVAIVHKDGRPRFNKLIWANNPKIAKLGKGDSTDGYAVLPNYPGCRPYIKKATHKRFVYNEDYSATPGEIYFSSEEVHWINQARARLPKFVLIEPHIKELGSPNKDWGTQKWQNVVDGLYGEIRFAQLDYGCRILRDVVPLKSPDFRAALMTLEVCQLFVGPEGGLHHAAGALHKRAVVLFGSFPSPSVTGYGWHENIYQPHTTDRTYCGLRQHCPECRAVMDSIAPSVVISAIRSQME